MHEDLSLEVRVIRDLVTSDVERVQVDSASSHERLTSFAATFMPDIPPPTLRQMTRRVRMRRELEKHEHVLVESKWLAKTESLQSAA